MLKKAGTLLLICASLATWISCGKTTAHYLYAAISTASEIYVYREDPNSGLLTELSFSPVAAGLGVHMLALHPSNKYLYAANSGEGDVSLFTVSSDGALNEVFPRATTDVAPNLLAMDPAGAYLYVANSGSNDISVFSIGSTGALTEVNGSPFQTGISATNMKLNPSGTALYATVSGSPGYVEAFSVSSGQLTYVGTVQTGINPNGMAISSNGSNVYTSNSDNSIWQFSTQSGGALSTGTSFTEEPDETNPVSLLIDNSGNYLCAANAGSNNISVYSIGSNGSLTALSSTVSPAISDNGPYFIASDPTAEYLFVGTQTAPTKIQSFAFSSSTGALTSVQSYTVPGTPTSIVIMP
jgi:6-phosphogluconolactonase